MYRRLSYILMSEKEDSEMKDSAKECGSAMLTSTHFLVTHLIFESTGSGPAQGNLMVWDDSSIRGYYSQRVQYRAPVGVGLFSCFTFGVDLEHTCNPFTSYYQYSTSGFGSDNFYCLCYDTSKPCPARDISRSPQLYISITVC